MDLAVLQILPDVNEEDFYVRRGPAETSGQRGHAPRLQALEIVRQLPCSDFFVLGILGPSVGWPLVDDLDNIYEASFFHEPLVGFCNVGGATHLRTGLDNKITVSAEGRVRGQSAVVTGVWDPDILHFEISARLDVVKAAFEEGGVVLEAAHHHSSMDEVKLGVV